MVRAKFIVESVTNNRHGSGSVKLSPVVSGSKENETFWQYTPSGLIELQTTNLDALNQFEVGKEYYVDFTKAE
jgi:hypothetical protein